MLIEEDVLRWNARLMGLHLRKPCDEDDFEQILGHLWRDLPERQAAISKGWAKAQRCPTGIQCFIRLEGDKQTNEQLTLEYVLGNVWSPPHRHGKPLVAGLPGERIVATYDGRLFDKLPDGSVIQHREGSAPLDHAPGSVHQPLILDGWVGLFWQPAGSEAVIL